MIPLHIILEGDNALKDWHDAGIAIRTLKPGSAPRVILLANGTESGKHTVAFAALTNDGRAVWIETTAALFLAAAVAIRGRIERDDPLP